MIYNSVVLEIYSRLDVKFVHKICITLNFTHCNRFCTRWVEHNCITVDRSYESSTLFHVKKINMCIKYHIVLPTGISVTDYIQNVKNVEVRKKAKTLLAIIPGGYLPLYRL